MKIDRRIGKEPVNKINWTIEEIRLLRDNFHKLSFEKLARLVGMPTSTVRKKLARMGLKKNHKHYAWTKSQTEFLAVSFRTKGNVEIAEILNNRWPRTRTWTKKHVEKKLMVMGWKRTPEEVEAIINKNKKQQRYDLTAAHAKRREMIANLTDDYIVSNCLRISKVSREQVKKEHRMLIEYTRNRITKARERRMQR